MVRIPPLSVLMSLVVLACVPPGQPPRPVQDQALITQDEIARTHAANAYDVIHTLRANFLSLRGETSVLATSSPYPTVYVDGQRYGGIDALRGIPATQIATIKLLRSWDAMTRYGNGNMGGVIAITTRLDGP